MTATGKANWKQQAGVFEKERNDAVAEREHWRITASQWRDRVHELEDEMVVIKGNMMKLAAQLQQETLPLVEADEA